MLVELEFPAQTGNSSTGAWKLTAVQLQTFSNELLHCSLRTAGTNVCSIQDCKGIFRREKMK
jgi:hypothetical protein